MDFFLKNINLGPIVRVFEAIFGILNELKWFIILTVALLVFFNLFKKTYLWLINERWDATIKRVLLEIKLPEVSIKPLKAMEQVFLGLMIIHDPTTWKEKWFEGKFLLTISLEIVGINGESHFYIRIPEYTRDNVEAIIYSQYPDAEISLAEDYTKNVPPNIPNEEWDLWGMDYKLTKETCYPLKTYPVFFEERAEVPIEEKRLDPLAPLLEGMAKLKEGEQLWVQILAKPVITPEDDPWREDAQEIINEIFKRKVEKERSILGGVTDVLLTGKISGIPSRPSAPTIRTKTKLELKPAGQKSKAELSYSVPMTAPAPLVAKELELTSGEKEAIKAIESKMARPSFQTSIRFIYLGKKNVFFKPHLRIAHSFFLQFATANFNSLKPFTKTITKTEFPLFKNRRLYLRKRAMFRRYIRRLFPLFPRSPREGRFILNTEELTTIYHFPSRLLAPAPTVPRVEAKKGEAPPGLPVE